METFGIDMGGSNPRQILITATIIILVIIVLYYLFIMFFGKSVKTTYLTTKMIDIMAGEKGTTASAVIMDTEAGFAEYSYGFWLYVKDFNKNIQHPRLILRRMNSGTGGICNPCVFMYPNTNTLGIRVSASLGGETPGVEDQNPIGKTADSGFFNETRACDIPDIPLQKWVHVAVNVRSNSMDVFVNGRLFRSCTLAGPVHQISGVGMSILDSLDFGENHLPGAAVSGVFVRSRPLNTQEASEIYSSGPGASMGGLLESTFGLKEVRFMFNDQSKGTSSYGFSF
jgi:hypothetical protein